MQVLDRFIEKTKSDEYSTALHSSTDKMNGNLSHFDRKSIYMFRCEKKNTAKYRHDNTVPYTVMLFTDICGDKDRNENSSIILNV